MIRIKYLFFIALVSILGTSGSFSMQKFPKTNIAIAFFPTDGGRWTDPMISSFIKNLQASSPNLNFTKFDWTFKTETQDFIKRISTVQPDIVFLPDAIMYKRMAKKISEETKALVVFTSIFLNSFELKESDFQAGVYCDPPIKSMLDMASLFKPIKSIGIVGDPIGGQKLINKIQSSLGESIDIEFATTRSWSEYKKIVLNFSNKHDAIWPMAPFGILTVGGLPVGDHQYNNFLKSTNKISLGYGSLSGLQRTLDMNIDPVDLGQFAARQVYKFLKGEDPSVVEFTSFGLAISDSHIKKFNLLVPEKLQGYIKL